MFRIFSLHTLLLLFITISSSQAQITQTIRGIILDSQSDAPLIGVSVQLLGNTSIGAVTDLDGRFILKNVPAGRQAIKATYLGFNEITIPNILVTAGKEVTLELKMEESLSKLNEIVITAKVDKDNSVNELSTVSSRQFNLEEVRRYSGGRSDVARLSSNFAGVAVTNDARNDIVIRGNSPTGVLWRMEGVPIPSPNHFSTLGTTGGPVSALNTNIIGNSDFLTGAFSAEYGNALAGVFDINLRTGNTENIEYTAQVGAFTGMEAMVEGPINKKNKGSFLAAYRHSFVEIANAAKIDFGTTAIPRYKDLSFHLDFGNTKSGKFSVFGIAATSSINFKGIEVDSSDLWGEPDRNLNNNSNFGVLGVKHNFFLNDHAYIRSVISGSITNISFDEDSIDVNFEHPFLITEVRDDLKVLRLSSYYNNKINAKTTLRAGVLSQVQHLSSLVQVRDGNPDLNGDGLPDWYQIRDHAGTFTLSEAYLQSQYRLSERLTLNGGLHGIYFDFTDDFALEPRFAVNYEIHKGHKLNFGYGLHHQMQPLPIFLYKKRLTGGGSVLSNQNLSFSRSNHFVLGYDYKPAQDWRIKAEVYYQAISRVPIDTFASSFSVLNTGNDFVFPQRGDLVNKGIGTNYGVEFTAEKFFSKGYYGLFTTSIFRSTYQGSDHIVRSTAFDGQYVLNCLLGKEIKVGSSGRKILTLDTKFTYAGGRPYTPLDLAASQLFGEGIELEALAFSERLTNYLRWDAKAGFRINSAKHKLSQTFFLDFQNITNHANVFAQRYNKFRKAVGTVNQIGFFPDLLYRVEF